ncbi:hypothetical protein [Nocardioides terrisoli]|uniref:hypothetical protein n=1 Tax=Nocardioides terrisoli TaxID=3388267 RepID=UPI00287B7BF3|nr:hypothetical protein [Nocardioides marmorisolisilvae]
MTSLGVTPRRQVADHQRAAELGVGQAAHQRVEDVGWTALVLGIGVMVPGIAGFLVSMLALAWFLVVGIVLAVGRPVTD